MMAADSGKSDLVGKLRKSCRHRTMGRTPGALPQAALTSHLHLTRVPQPGLGMRLLGGAQFPPCCRAVLFLWKFAQQAQHSQSQPNELWELKGTTEPVKFHPRCPTLTQWAPAHPIPKSLLLFSISRSPTLTQGVSAHQIPKSLLLFRIQCRAASNFCEELPVTFCAKEAISRLALHSFKIQTNTISLQQWENSFHRG